MLLFHNLNNVTNLKLVIKNSALSTLRIIELVNPPDIIGWDGKNNNGSQAGFSGYQWDLYVSNICESKLYTGSFTKVIDPDPNDPVTGPYLDHTPVPKPYISCPFSFNYSSFSRPPKACCSSQPDLHIANRDIWGQWDYILLNTITAGPAATVKAGSDVLFQAGTQISLLPGFTVEPGTEFDAVITGCTPTERLASPTLPISNYPAHTDGQVSKENPVQGQPDEISIFPNPGNGKYTLTSAKSISRIYVIDVYGKEIKEYEYPGTSEISIDLTGYHKGIYFIRAEYTDGNGVMKKIIYQ